jgi:uncharacterized cupin superfamily protein
MKITRTRQAEWQGAINKGKFQQRRIQLEGGRLAAGLWELPPGKRSFPFHAHHMTEEAMFVVSGHAKVRTPEGETAIGPGDHVYFPPGGAAHQLINDGSEPLVYLAMSASVGIDIVEYPDSGKVAASVGQFPSAKRFVFRAKDQVDYFDGEE